MYFSQDKLYSTDIIIPSQIQEEMDDDEDEIPIPKITFSKIQNDDDIKFRLMQDLMQRPSEKINDLGEDDNSSRSSLLSRSSSISLSSSMTNNLNNL